MGKITKIKMTVGKHEIEMTLEEAKDFQKLLNETFPDYSSRIINPVIIERVREYPYRPYPFWRYEVTCDNTGTLSWDSTR
jgi:hypothetical protein